MRANMAEVLLCNYRANTQSVHYSSTLASEPPYWSPTSPSRAVQRGIEFFDGGGDARARPSVFS